MANGQINFAPYEHFKLILSKGENMPQLAKFNSNNLSNDFFGDRGSLGYFVSPLHVKSLTSNFKVDINDSEKAYVFYADLPSVSKDDLHENVDVSTVTIAAEIKQYDEKTKDEKVVKSERYFGSVSRCFQLPVDVD
jgi:HSP20 family protein